jgi:hypothetical protein
VSIDPTPVPWLVTLTGGGRAPVVGVGQPIGFTAQFPDGSVCVFDPPKIPLRFLVTRVVPVPLEPGDPLIRYRLVRTASDLGCPRVASEGLTMAASAMGANGREESVLIQDF